MSRASRANSRSSRPSLTHVRCLPLSPPPEQYGPCLTRERRISDPPDDYNLLPYSIHVVAGTLKLWFRELPEPLLTYELYDKFISAQRTSLPP